MDDRQALQLLAVGQRLFEALDLETVLDRALESARELTGARYAALGILDRSGDRLERFLTVGIDPDTRDEIGDLPDGRGVLGELIRDPRPLRLTDVSMHPRSYGFPPGHPPMTTFLGVPIGVGGEAYGNLYLTDKEGGAAFDADDQHAATTLAEWAAAAIRNARLHGQVSARREELEHAVESLRTMTEIARTLAGETSLARILELIAKRGRALMDARSMAILLVDGDAAVVVACAGELISELRGMRVPLAGSLSGHVIATGRAERLTALNRKRYMQHGFGAHGVEATTGLFMPLVFRHEVIGVLAALDRFSGTQDFSAHDEELLEAFAASAANAVWTAQSASGEQRRRSVQATEAERRRWARELHDETLQELAAVRLNLAAVRDGGEGELRASIDAAVIDLERNIGAVRGLIADVRPSTLDELGLAAALEDLAARLPRRGLDADFDINLGYETGRHPTRLVAELEDALYRLAQEALNNVLKHAGTSHARVMVREGDAEVVLTVRDEGRGFDPHAAVDGFGLVGMRERAELAGGRLEVDSRPGEGTTVRAIVPARHRPPASGGTDAPKQVASGD